jgi:hypothetical protein
MADPLLNLRAAYLVLESRVNLSLRTQLGDTTRLRHQRDEAFRFLQAAEPVSPFYVSVASHECNFPGSAALPLRNLLYYNRILLSSLTVWIKHVISPPTHRKDRPLL